MKVSCAKNRKSNAVIALKYIIFNSDNLMRKNLLNKALDAKKLVTTKTGRRIGPLKKVIHVYFLVCLCVVGFMRLMRWTLLTSCLVHRPHIAGFSNRFWIACNRFDRICIREVVRNSIKLWGWDGRW